MKITESDGLFATFARTITDLFTSDTVDQAAGPRARDHRGREWSSLPFPSLRADRHGAGQSRRTPCSTIARSSPAA